jgi:hypothetical protein
MDNKKWWQSKTVWAGVVAVILAAYGTAASQFGLPPIPEWVFGILGALGIYGRTTASTTIK